MFDLKLSSDAEALFDWNDEKSNFVVWTVSHTLTKDLSLVAAKQLLWQPRHSRRR